MKGPCIESLIKQHHNSKHPEHAVLFSTTPGAVQYRTVHQYGVSSLPGRLLRSEYRTQEPTRHDV
jgi:hypothetical protein